MFKSVLVANRGEIACRVFRTARRLGLRTIAVHSEADARALHVREADEAVLLGPAPARESYLDADKVLAAAKATGAEAIHPGYGFLSENADFAEAVMAAGIVWIGPHPSSIRAMGLKDAAKKLMIEAGVPVTPGYQGEDQSLETLSAEAARIGYPVLIKAVAGGGGKGMRLVDKAEDFAGALASAQREGQSSFGDPRVLIESYITRPRHIEVQVFGDSHGTVVHLHERDCSLQRRHQKVIEEAPAPGMDQATRDAVTAAAVRAAQAVNYVGAGTIEFIADASDGLKADRIWFMEMNTRLQVEHPVTEAITGVDLVEWQLRVAAGEPIPLKQADIPINGRAMEARLYAEDPANGFLPSIGRLDHFVLPDDIRVDTGVEQGGEVSQFYDPMIAKLIVHDDTREAAAARLAVACREVEVWPVRTNAGFLARCLDHPRFVEGDVDTGFIAAEEGALTAVDLSDALIQDASDLLWRSREVDSSDVWDSEYGASGFRLNAAAVTQQTFFVDGVRHQAPYQNNYPVVRYGPEIDGGFVVFHGGDAHEVSRHALRGATAGSASDGSLRAPMPGKIVAAPVKAGDTVTKGQPVVVLEAMKMEHALTAPFDGVVAEFNVSVGDQAAEGAVLARVEAAHA
ncbi:acetyl/propionyl/methylcrotonyl-CoA carboxylase subunit alpha [Brevundimonas sp. S30B]|uniref:acetyl/propionyl/methylcrotonyl-CoA carboxylase subunit alpha n=1 Tax=unclassified Brevundimonas TaxID=2622653 RepID=UPI001071CAEA|nr:MULTISPECIES: acetyl/propionyl/methylcrotonyl-CoA carboxylase subunit alpha [unclassified Brevundimonas]QBX36331.1 acetyl/propionyl/methylcrotonyl-CoA carboxylase subunit alpha [Brevundimonas sp. MF30-B]TFW01040.1 acetyl/propionyl/methylcrotonyl-CoA carboxylase subunit alpha [Brevundimonas sp. S30B]